MDPRERSVALARCISRIARAGNRSGDASPVGPRTNPAAHARPSSTGGVDAQGIGVIFPQPARIAALALPLPEWGGLRRLFIDSPVFGGRCTHCVYRLAAPDV